MALVVKNSLANAGDLRDASSIPGLGRSPGGGNGNSLHQNFRAMFWVTDRLQLALVISRWSLPGCGEKGVLLQCCGNLNWCSRDGENHEGSSKN